MGLGRKPSYHRILIARADLSRPLLWCALLLAAPTPIVAQRDSLPTAIRGWEGVAVVGGVALLSGWDASVRAETQEHRSPTGEQVAAIVRHLGQPEVFVTVPATMIAVGLAAGRPALGRSGERVAASLALAGALSVATKFLVGRLRPNETTGQYAFRPFSGAAAFPSGHTTMAFALATSLANELRRRWATIALLIGATGTAWSRVNDNRHWLSDVAGGAVVGIASAQFIGRRWTVFSVHPPAFFAAPGQVGVAWQFPIRLP